MLPLVRRSAMTAPLRILLVTETLVTGGAETFVLRLARHKAAEPPLPFRFAVRLPAPEDFLHGVSGMKGRHDVPQHIAEGLTGSRLRVVDAVTIFQGVRATDFLKLVKPDVYVKGGDYTIDTLDQGEREALLECGAEIRILQLVPGKSTTSTLERIRG